MDKNEIFFTLGNALAGVLIGLLTYWIAKTKKFIKKKIESASVKHLNNNQHIRDILLEMRLEFDADRVLLYQFHNGDQYASGASYKKASITHQAIKRGIAPVSDISAHLSIPMSMIMPCISGILKNKFGISNLHDADDSCHFKFLLLQGGVQKCIMILIPGAKNTTSIGVAFVCWLNDIEPTPEQVKLIEPFADRIGEELQIEGRTHERDD